MCGGGIPLSSSLVLSPPLYLGYIVVMGWVLTCPPACRLCPASQLHRLPWTLPTGRAADCRLCHFLQHHTHLASVFAASPDNARRTDPVLRVFIMYNDSNRRSPATPAHLEDAGTILSVSECSFFWMFNKGGFCVFISHSKLERPDPMPRFEHCCHHVPAIGCNCQ